MEEAKKLIENEHIFKRLSRELREYAKLKKKAKKEADSKEIDSKENTPWYKLVDDVYIGFSDKTDSLIPLYGMIYGVKDTPYEYSFLLFEIIPSKDYPATPPKFKFISPDNENCRMHPNLYACGKCCLSILNTWAENQYNPGLTLRNILMTIRSILIPSPITQEPVYESMKENDPNAINYKIRARIQSARCGILRILEGKTPENVPTEFIEIAKSRILSEIPDIIASLLKYKDIEINTSSSSSFTFLHGSASDYKAAIDKLITKISKYEV
jgi:ubiquitin-protein ligase